MASNRSRKLLKRTRKFLKQRHALSSDMAVEITDTQWQEIGWPNNPANNIISDALTGTIFETMNGVKKTKEGKFWFDEINYKKYNKIGCLIFAFFFILTFLVILAIPIAAIIFSQ